MDHVDQMSGQGALTDAMNFRPNPRAVKSRSYTHAVPTSNGSSHLGGSTIQISIPTGGVRGTYADLSQSYLKFKVQNKDSTHAITFDGHGSSVIRRLDIYHGSMVESIENYNVLYSCLRDSQLNGMDRVLGGAIASGAAPLTEPTVDTSASSATGAVVGSLTSTLRKGVTIAANSSNAVISSMVVAFPLVSAILGANAEKYLPLGAMGAAQLRMDIQLEDVAQAFLTSSTTQYEILECEFVMTVVEVDSMAQSMIDQATGGVYMISAHSFRGFTGNVASGNGSAAISVPARFSSLNALYIAHRNQTCVNGSTHPSITNRSRANLRKAQLRVGSLTVPQRPIKCDESSAEAYLETMKAFHSVSAIQSHTSFLPSEYVQDNAQTDSSRGSFLLGIELSAFAHKSDTIYNGMNTLQSPILAEFEYATTPGNMVINFYARYDKMLVIGTDGLLTAKF